jgi:hypothetical protein
MLAIYFQHDIGTLEASECLTDKLLINGLKILGMVKEDIGCVLALRSAPIIVQALHEAGDLAVKGMGQF